MTKNPAPGPAIVTRVAAFSVRHGEDARFQAWQQRMCEALLRFPGALQVDVLPANMTDAGHEWIVISRFRSDADLARWLDSAEYRSLRHAAPDIFAGNETQYTLGSGAAPDSGETLVTSNIVIAGREREYEAADRALNEAAARYPGFVDAKVLKPMPGSRTWSTVIRFDNKSDLDRWLAAPERETGRRELYKHTESDNASIVPTGFGSWFAVNAEDVIEAPAWKQAMTVLAALFPTVMVLTLTVDRFLSHENAPLAVAIFAGNILSIIVLTWALMPALTRMLAWWLSPRATQAQTWKGAGMLLALYAAEIAFFMVIGAPT